jgi:ATP-dependent DNA helicase RecQ
MPPLDDLSLGRRPRRGCASRSRPSHSLNVSVTNVRGETVCHPRWGEGVVMSTETDRVTVLFADHGYKTLSLDAVRENDLLTPC